MNRYLSAPIEPELTAEISRILGIDPPLAGTSAQEISEWVAYWRDAAEHAKSLTAEEIAYLKAGGWWPPVTAENIRTIPPPIVTQTLRRSQ